MGIGEQFELEKTGRIMPESWGKEQKMDLSKANTNDLKEELERREREEEARNRIPDTLGVRDFNPVTEQCIEYIRCVSEDCCGLQNIKVNVFEAAMNAVYGEKVWGYINSKIG